MKKRKQCSVNTATGEQSIKALLKKVIEQQRQRQVPLDKQNRGLVALAQAERADGLRP